MEINANDKPPKWILKVFRLFCRPEFREDIEGDLLERYHKRASRLGVAKAKWLFTRDVIFLLRPNLVRGFQHRSQIKIGKMKRVKWIAPLLVNLIVVLMIVSPFIPGPSNKVVGILSFLGQLAGMAGLLLVPIGMAWIIIETAGFKPANVIERGWQYRLAIGITTLIGSVFLVGILFLPNPMPKLSCLVGLIIVMTGFVSALSQLKKWREAQVPIPKGGSTVILAAITTACLFVMGLFSSLAVFALAGIAGAITSLVLLSIGIIAMLKQIKKMKYENARKFKLVPLCLITVPLVAFLTSMFVVEPASGFSRSFAIKRSEALIIAIEDFKSRTGEYPETMREVYTSSHKKIPKPLIMGIGDFRYNRIDGSYSLSFSQWLDLGSLEEIVFYDKNDQVKNGNLVAPYDYNLDLHRIKTAFAGYDTKHQNWRYYRLD